jgi:hypothetical protein
MYNTQIKQGEKRMRVRTLLAAAAGLMLSGAAANADIVVTFTRAAGTGNNAGQDVIRFFGAFSPTSPVGQVASALQSVSGSIDIDDAHSPANSVLKFRFVDENGDSINDADTDSSTVGTRTTTASNATLGTHFRIGPTGAGAWTPVLVEPTGDTSVTDPNTGDPIGPQPEQNYGGLKHFRVEGANPLSPDAAGETASAGQPGAGALFAVAVVPTGANVRVFGQIAGNAGPIENFDVSTFPEPGTLSVLGVGALGLLRRRRRA